MKKLITLLLSLFFVTGLAFATDPACGIWKSVDDKSGKVTAIWKIYEKDGKLFGTIAATVDEPQNVRAESCKDSYKDFPVAGKVNQMTVVGTPWIFNMKKDAPGVWSGGNIIDPSNGKMYGCVIKFMAAGSDKKAPVDTLAMAGTVGPIKVFQYWVRSSEAEIQVAQAKYPAK